MEEICPDRNFSAHNALDDCRALHLVLISAVIRNVGVGEEDDDCIIRNKLVESLAKEYFDVQYVINRLDKRKEGCRARK